MPTTIGVVGIGRIGSMHAANLATLRDAWRPHVCRHEGSHDAGPHSGADLDLILADIDPGRAAEEAARLTCRSVTGVDELFADGLDGLVVAVGTAEHAPLITRAAEAGIPVFCEKPVAESTAAAEAVLQTLERVGATVQIGHQRRLDAGHLEARRALHAGELGWLHTLRAVTNDMFPPPVEFIATSGGLFRDCSVHDFDALQWLTGQQVVEVYARGSNRGDPAIGDVGDVDSAIALATLADGTIASVSATRYNGAGHDVRLEMHGSVDTVHIGLDSSYAGHSVEPGFDYPATSPHRTFHERFAPAYAEEMRAFVQLIRGERQNPCPAAEAVDASRVADAAQLSLETGRPQPVQR